MNILFYLMILSHEAQLISASSSDHFKPGIHWIGGPVRPRVSTVTVEQGKSLAPAGNRTQSVAHCCTDLALPAPYFILICGLVISKYTASSCSTDLLQRTLQFMMNLGSFTIARQWSRSCLSSPIYNAHCLQINWIQPSDSRSAYSLSTFWKFPTSTQGQHISCAHSQVLHFARSF